MTSSTIRTSQASETSSREKRLRLLIVSRHFWPHSSLTELGMADLALQLTRAGHHVMIVSSRGGKEWTPRIQYREIPVFRIARQPTGPWSTYRYLRAYTQFFSEQRNLDGVIVAGVGDEALATTRFFAGKVPVVLRVDNSMDGVQDQLHRRHVEICQNAARVVCNCDALARRISRIAEMPEVSVIRDGVQICHRERNLASQAAARTALADTHPILQTDPTQPLVLSGMRMADDIGTIDLVDCWKYVLNSFPAAKLWLLGDGTMGSRIWQRIVSLNLVHSVIMPGYFDDLEDLFFAANLYVHPGRTEASCECLPRAMATGLPPIVTDTRWIGAMIRPDLNAWVVSRQNPLAMAEAIVHAIKHSELRKAIGEQAKSTVEAEFCPDRQIQQYIGLLRLNADSKCKNAAMPN
jgi:glycosyltransferase involved in cell wall biosynthesis